MTEGGLARARRTIALFVLAFSVAMPFTSCSLTAAAPEFGAAFPETSWLRTQGFLLSAPPSGVTPTDVRDAEAVALTETNATYAGGIRSALLASVDGSIGVPAGSRRPVMAWVVALESRAHNGHLVVFVDARSGKYLGGAGGPK
jgi:hypothetical protein